MSSIYSTTARGFLVLKLSISITVSSISSSNKNKGFFWNMVSVPFFQFPQEDWSQRSYMCLCCTSRCAVLDITTFSTTLLGFTTFSTPPKCKIYIYLFIRPMKKMKKITRDAQLKTNVTKIKIALTNMLWNLHEWKIIMAKRLLYISNQSNNENFSEDYHIGSA